MSSSTIIIRSLYFKIMKPTNRIHSCEVRLNHNQLYSIVEYHNKSKFIHLCIYTSVNAYSRLMQWSSVIG
ncbi:hypothetical protein BLOT_000407 [Blomia tropicalis]|nr:hypothetical protein BLOT_000407 [Blomia tropicalis]